MNSRKEKSEGGGFTRSEVLLYKKKKTQEGRGPTRLLLICVGKGEGHGGPGFGLEKGKT